MIWVQQCAWNWYKVTRWWLLNKGINFDSSKCRYISILKFMPLEVMWKRWTTPHPNIGDGVIIRDDSKNWNQWKLAIATDLIRGRDGIVRGTKLRTSKDNLECTVQHLYPLELHQRKVDSNPKMHCNWKHIIEIFVTSPLCSESRSGIIKMSSFVEVNGECTTGFQNTPLLYVYCISKEDFPVCPLDFLCVDLACH